VGKFAAFIERPKAKNASASGGLCHPDPLTRGSAPGPCWGQILRASSAIGYSRHWKLRLWT